MCKTYRGLSFLLWAIGLPVIVALIGAWEFWLEPVLDVEPLETLETKFDFFFTTSFFSIIAITVGSVIVYFLGANLDREQVRREKMTADLTRAQRIGQVGTWEWREREKSVVLSSGAADIVGLSAMRGKIDEEMFFALIAAEDQENFLKELENLLQFPGSFDRIHRIVRSDDTVRVVHTHGESLTDPAHKTRIVGVTGTLHDITERVEAEERMRLHTAVFTHSSEAIVVTDADGVIVDINPAFTLLTGYTPDEVMGKNPNLLKSDEHPRSFYAGMWREILTTGSWRGEISNRVKNGRVVPMELYISAVPDERGKPTRFVSILSDMTVHKEYEESLRRLSVTDPLTGVANRRSFDTTLDEEWRRGIRRGLPLTLLMIDIDYFKQFNDTFGHQEGDRCLKEVAKTLDRIVMRPGDLVARYGGEEFAVVLPETSPAEGLLIAETMREAIIADQKKIFPRHLEKPVTISVGVASTIPQRDEKPETLLRRADAALYRAKSDGRNRAALSDTTGHRSSRTLSDRLR